MTVERTRAANPGRLDTEVPPVAEDEAALEGVVAPISAGRLTGARRPLASTRNPHVVPIRSARLVAAERIGLVVASAPIDAQTLTAHVVRGRRITRTAIAIVRLGAPAIAA